MNEYELAGLVAVARRRCQRLLVNLDMTDLTPPFPRDLRDVNLAVIESGHLSNDICKLADFIRANLPPEEPE